MKSKKGNKRVFLVSCLFHVHSASTSPDSARYMSNAFNIYNGKGYVDTDQTTKILDRGPGFPFIIANRKAILSITGYQRYPPLTLNEKIAMIKECLQMGAAVFDFVGGEISISGDFAALLPCTEPQRTYISLTSNGFLMTRDLYENLGEVGCSAVKQTLYISEYEDVMPCAFTHISFENLKYESLRDIRNRALKIEKTNRVCPLCGSQENKWVTAGREHEFNNTTHDLFCVVRCR